MRLQLVVVFCAALSTCTKSGWSSVPTMLIGEGGVSRDTNRIVGFEFQTDRPITVTELGKFDGNRNGTLDDLRAPQVGIWSADQGELVVATTVDRAADLESGAFFGPVIPTVLSPGNYVIGVQSFAEQEPYIERAPMQMSSQINWVQGRYRSGTEFAFPSSTRRVMSLFGPSLKIDEPLALFGPGERSVFQRDVNNLGRVPLTGFVGVGVERIEARAVVMQGASGIDSPWQTIEHANGLLMGELIAPAGGWYRIEARAISGTDVLATYSIDRVGVGEVFVTAGQSNSANFGRPAMVSNSDFVSAMSASGDWRHAADPQPIANGTGGSPWPALGDALVERLGVPIGFVSVGWGGTQVGQWVPGAAGPDANPLYDRLDQALRMLGPDGARAVLWHQGESDARAQTDANQYAQLLDSIVQASRQDAGYAIPWGIALAAHLPQNDPQNQAAIVSGQLQVIDHDPLTFAGPLTDDLVGSTWRWDAVHFNERGLREHAARWADALAAFLNPHSAAGDFNSNGVLDARDIDALSRHLKAGLAISRFDVNGDSVWNDADRTFWIENLAQSYFGDSNLDGEFDSADLVAVLRAGEYEDRSRLNSTWASGDWNGDAEFDSGDLLLAFVGGGYEQGPRVELQTVPETSATALLAIGLVAAALNQRSRHRRNSASTRHRTSRFCSARAIMKGSRANKRE